jgi:hypothetical protein
MMIRHLRKTIILGGILLGWGCAPQGGEVFDNDGLQPTLRQIQSRTFDSSDKNRTMRTVIQTMQDLGFAVDKADEELGSISGMKLDGYALRMTVTVFPKGGGSSERPKEMLVRANAQHNVTPVVDPEPYRRFFTALERSMRLAAEEVR